MSRTTVAKRALGRSELKPFSDWDDGRPETELNFKLYRQATNAARGPPLCPALSVVIRLPMLYGSLGQHLREDCSVESEV